MSYQFSDRTLRNLEGVDQRLVDIVYRAKELCAEEFTCVDGLRTVEEQRVFVQKGSSRTMNSYHLTGCAVDLYVNYPGGGVNMQAPIEAYAEIARAMKEAGAEMGIEVIWGGDWHNFKDFVHYQIAQDYDNHG